MALSTRPTKRRQPSRFISQHPKGTNIKGARLRPCQTKVTSPHCLILSSTSADNCSCIAIKGGASSKQNCNQCTQLKASMTNTTSLTFLIPVSPVLQAQLSLKYRTAGFDPRWLLFNFLQTPLNIHNEAELSTLCNLHHSTVQHFTNSG